MPPVSCASRYAPPRVPEGSQAPVRQLLSVRKPSCQLLAGQGHLPVCLSGVWSFLTLESRARFCGPAVKPDVASLNWAFQGFWPQDQIAAVAWASLEVWIIFFFYSWRSYFELYNFYFHVVFFIEWVRRMTCIFFFFFFIDICWFLCSSVLYNSGQWFLNFTAC